MVTIKIVAGGSPAEHAGIKPGDALLSVNGNPVGDILDYQFHMAETNPSLLLERGGREFSVRLEKGEYADAGLGFKTYIMDEKRGCGNKCLFCFIDQLPPPPALRETLYFKDDDERLSFLFGNYITLTNLTEAHIERIAAMRLSPINISVHTTDPALRARLMGNPRAGEVLAYIPRLAAAGIKLNFQIVLCRGINDGAELERTLRDLCAHYPATESVAVVPAGLTKYREQRGLCHLEPFSPQECREIISLIDAVGGENLRRHGERLVYASDEFFLRAGLPIPGAEYYEEYPQLDNGVGMSRDMEDSFLDALRGVKRSPRLRHVSVATGETAYPLIARLAGEFAKRSDVRVDVFQIKNDFFGPGVTVAGLVTGADLERALLPRRGSLGEVLYIPATMLRREGDLFLDGMEIPALSASLGVPVVPVQPDGASFVGALAGDAGENDR